MTESLRQRLAAQLCSLDGVVESPSMFGVDNAFWCNGKEIAHFDSAEVGLQSDDDIAFVVELAERAAAAHRAGPGETTKEPPRGSDLERRRRFH